MEVGRVGPSPHTLSHHHCNPTIILYCNKSKLINFSVVREGVELMIPAFHMEIIVLDDEGDRSIISTTALTWGLLAPNHAWEATPSGIGLCPMIDVVGGGGATTNTLIAYDRCPLHEVQGCIRDSIWEKGWGSTPTLL